MNKIDILIVEDNTEEASILEDFLTNNHFNIAAKVTNLEDALKVIDSKPFDIAIIDIHLGEHPHGFTIAEEINILFKAKKPFLFLTGSSGKKEFNEAKYLAPFRYLLKPFNELELIFTLELIINQYTDKQSDVATEDVNDCFPLLLKKKNSFFKVEEDDIIYIEVEGRYCNIITSNLNFLVKTSLDDFTKSLPKKNFIKTHRKYVINKNAVKEVILSQNTIILKGDYNVSLGRTYKNDFMELYNIIR